MGETTEIAWTDHTFNPWVGCSRVSPGCQNCYAEALDKRWSRGEHWGKAAPRRVTSDANWRKPLKWNRDAEAAGRPALVFCASMADVFEDRPDLVAPRARLFDLIDQTPNLIWLLLTKRPENAARLVAYWHDNVWVGTTAEDQARLNERLPYLLGIPAAVRFLSCEPLLEHVAIGQRFLECWHDSATGVDQAPDGPDKLWRCDSCAWVYREVDDPEGTITTERMHHPESRRRVRHETVSPPRLVDWVIAGGESGPGHRPMDGDHARALRDECRRAGVPFFFKQWGGATPKAGGDLLDGHRHHEWPTEAGDRTGVPS